MYSYFGFSEKEKIKTAEQKDQLPNSNPADCNEIGLLGYRLNDFYLVNSSKSAAQFGVFFCQFKLPRPDVIKCKRIFHYYFVIVHI